MADQNVHEGCMPVETEVRVHEYFSHIEVVPLHYAGNEQSKAAIAEIF